MSHARSPLATLATTLGVLACAAPAAHAGTVNFQPFSSADPLTGNYNYNAATGEAANDLLVQRIGPITSQFMSFVDANYVVIAGNNCTQLPAGQAQCPRGLGGSHYIVRLRDGDDRARVFVPAGVPEVYGGVGNDDLAADTFGTGALVYGEGGDDRVSSSGDGGALADGGSGNDSVFCCGGQSGGTAVGGSGNDYISALAAQDGTVDADGGTGDDTIISRISANTRPARADGGDGNDVIVVNGRGDHADGRRTVTGGDGRDYIDVLGGGTDTVTCGAGDNDVVRYDPTDIVSDDCEIKLLTP